MPAEFIHHKNRVLILAFIFSESIFFAFLITAFVLYHGRSPNGPNAHNTLDPVKTGIYSVILWASSLTMWLSERSMMKFRLDRCKRWLEATMILGGIFLIGQGLEYHGMFAKGISVGTDLFATTFFSTTGFHGLHVFIGLIVLLIMRGLTSAGFGQEEYQREGFIAASYYWHFVDAIWVAVFFILYVWGTR
ncbi:MAG: heme-copper oxidase subunit III [Candidatus Sulfotelmatobacter sp.]